MSAKKKSAGKGGKRAKPAKVKAKAAAPKKGSVAKKGAKKVAAKKAAPKKVAKKAAPRKAAPKKAAPKKVAKKAPAAKAKKSAAKAAPKKRTTAAKPKAPIARRDGAGHLDPQYEADLRERIKEEQPPADENRAFLAESRTGESVAEELGEEFVETVTSGEDEGVEIRDQRVTEELGGPFTVTTGGTEFAEGEDASNPDTATREPFPRT